MADPVQSSNVNDFSKDADVLAAKIEMVKKQVDQLAGSLSSVNSQFTKFGKAAGKTYNPKINVSTGSGSSNTHGLNENDRLMRQGEANAKRKREQDLKDYVKKAQQYQKEEERLWLATERWKRHKVQREDAEYAAYKKQKEKEEAAAEQLVKKIKKEEQEKQRKDRIKHINKIGFVLKTVGLAITAFAAAAHKWISNALENISSTRYNSSFDTLTKELQEADNATTKMSSTWKSFTKAFTAGFSGIISGIASVLQWFIDKFAGIIAFLMGDSNGSEKYQAAVDAQTRSEKVGYVQSVLRGRGFSGKATTTMSKNAVQYALQRMRNTGGYEGLTDTQLLNHDDFDTYLNEGLEYGKDSTLIKGYAAEKYGRAYAMIDRTPEENARLYDNLMKELSAPGVTNEKYNDMIKQWTKTGRIIEKFGKNLYSFDEVLSNDPFSNEEITDINDATGGIEDGVNEGNNTLEASYHTLEDVLEAYKKGNLTLEEALAAIKANGIDTTKFIEDFVAKLKTTAPFTSKGIDKLSQTELLKLALEDLKLALTPSNITGKVSPGQGFLNTLGKIWEATTHDEHGNRVSKITGDTLPTSEFEKQDYFGEKVYSASADDAKDVIEDTISFIEDVRNVMQRMKRTSGVDSKAAQEWYNTLGGMLEDYKNIDVDFLVSTFGENEAIKMIYDLIVPDIGQAKMYADGFYESIIEYYDRNEDWGARQKSEFESAFKLNLGKQLLDSLGEKYKDISDKVIEPAYKFDLTSNANGSIATRKMPTLSTLFEEGPEMVLPLNAAGADFLANSLNNLGLSNRLTNNSANVNVNLSGINIADNDREWYEVAHKIHNIIEAEQARQGG